MPKRKIAKKELVRPDEFLSFTTRAFNFVKDRRNQFAYAAIGLVLLAFAWWAWQKYQQRYERQAAIQLNQASQLIATAFLPSPPGSTSTNQKAKIEEGIAALNSLLAQFPRSRLMAPALLYLGDARYRLREYDQAIFTYQKVLDLPKLDPGLRALTYNALGYAYLAKNDYATAANYFSQASSSPTLFLKEQALFNQAQAYEKANNLNKAREAYRQLVREFPTTPRAALARLKLAAFKP